MTRDPVLIVVLAVLAVIVIVFITLLLCFLVFQKFSIWQGIPPSSSHLDLLTAPFRAKIVEHLIWPSSYSKSAPLE